MCGTTRKGEKVDCHNCNCSSSVSHNPGGHDYYLSGNRLYCRNCLYSGWP
jgi:hypothetical protein